ncbi:MAG: TonB-dependent receptor [Chitinophagaceae bacterium]|nr:MAG: TonB-dependent receptor [Chitinophagaceae bacterium]
MRQLLLLTCLAAAPHLCAQTISGTVKDTSGRPLAAATITLLRVNDSIPQRLALSDAAGRFQISLPSAGSYILCASHVAFSRSCSAPFTNNNAPSPSLVLQPKGGTLQEVTVAVQRPVLEARADRLVVNVEGTLNSVGSTALDVLRRSPGVSVDHEDNLSISGKNGVQVFIDGRPSPLSGTELSAYLSSLQSSQIDAIEIISNPSAKYEAAGNGGIINIRMKKNKALGTNGSVNAGFGIGVYAKYNAGFSINHRTKHFNIFGTYTAAVNKNLTSTDTYRVLNDSVFDQHARRITTDRPHNVQAGIDYFIGKAHTIGVLLNLLPGKQRLDNSSGNDISGVAGGAPARYLESVVLNDIERRNTGVNLNYRFASGTREFNADFDRSAYRSYSDQVVANDFYNGQRVYQNHSGYHMLAPGSISMWAGRASYDRDAWKGRISFGGKYGSVTSDNTLDPYDVFPSGEKADSSRHNSFLYEEAVSALFARFQKDLPRVSWQIGVRTEHTEVRGRSRGFRSSTGGFSAYDSAFTRSYTDLFPSLSLTFKDRGRGQFGISLGRRIDRPPYQDLNPFEFRSDVYTSRRGNTALRPQYTDVIELTHVWRGRLTSILTYSRVHDVFTQIFDTTERFKSFITRSNVQLQQVASLSINYVLQGKKHSGFLNINPAYNSYSGNFGKDRNLELEAFSVTMKAQYGYRFGRGWSAEAAAQYNSPGIGLGFFYGRANGSFDLAAARTAFQNRLSIKAAISDIFFTAINGGHSFFAGQYMEVQRSFEPRVLRINVAYRFGSNTVKAARNRKTLIDEENKRLQTSN